MISRLIGSLASKVPNHSSMTYVAQGAGVLAVAAPMMGVVLPQANLWLPHEYIQAAEAGMGLVTIGLESLLFSKLIVKNKWIKPSQAAAKKRQVVVGGMIFDEKSLFTNIIAFGAIGSGKTAAVVYPILDQITGIYNDENAASPTAKWGGFVLDVKGDFHEAVIYVMQKHGRDVLKDLVVIRPDNDYYVVEFEDQHTQDHFLVAATGGIQSQECDKVLAKATGPEDILKKDTSGLKFLRMPNGDQEKVSSFLFSDKSDFLRPEVHNALKQLEFDVNGMNIRWLGWREEAGRLVRVSNTVDKTTQFAQTPTGTRIFNDKPTKLKYIGVHSINNGLTYNLISKNAASTEAAGRIMAVAEVTGNSMGGDNAYWSNASEKHIAACVELKRQIEGPMGSECSVQDIQKFTTNDQFLSQQVSKLKGVIKTKQQQGISDYEILLLRNLDDYFTGEWLKHDPKTKGNIMSCVTNLFGDVTRNQQLIKTFCQPSKFSFEACLNDGKIYTLVLSAYPNAQQLIGTCMKLDFQQTVLKRTTAAPVNKDRFLMFLADEYQFFITTSGGGKAVGDDKFLSVSRQSKIFNMICTQAISSFLAVQKDEHKINAFLQCIGGRIFLQNLDDKTNKHAEMILGQIHIEKVSHSGADLKLSSLLGEGKSGSASRSTEKSRRYEESHFGQMAPFEAVMFNKERPPGDKIVKANLREQARFWDKGMLADAANNYYQAYLENRAYELGISYLFDAKNNVHQDDQNEKDQRAKSIFRSWRNTNGQMSPIGLIKGTEIQTNGEISGEDEPSLMPGEEIQPEQEAQPDGIERELGGYPDFEELRAYNNKPLPYYSDLEASQNSDPFFSRSDEKVTVTPNEGERIVQPTATPPGGEAKPDVTTQAGIWETGLSQLNTDRRTNRVLANKNVVVEEINEDGHTTEERRYEPNNGEIKWDEKP